MRTRPLVLFTAFVLGCGPTSEAVSIGFMLGESGAMFSVLADSSTVDSDIEVDWAVEFENLRSQPCPVNFEEGP